jgi:hypothetical protein
MARSEARLSTSIWADPDFRALTRDAQWAFMFLISQHDLAHDGVLALRVRRLSQSAAGLTVAVLGEALRELERTHFVVIDRDCEELLIRSFIRRDKVFKQPNVLRAALDHLPMVTSPTIRAALAVELARISDEGVPDGSWTIVADMRKALPDPCANPSLNPSPNPSEMGTTDPSLDPSPGTPGVRGVVKTVTTGFPAPRSSKSPAPLGGDESPTAKTLIGEWIDNCRKRPVASVIGQVGKQIKAMLEEGVDPGDIRSGLEAWRSKGQHPSTLPSFVNAVANADATANGRASPRGLVEHNGLRLKPETVANIEGRARFEAMDAQQLAIEGTAS